MDRKQTARRIGGLTRALQNDQEQLANARKSFMDRFEREVDPDGVLSLPERMRLAKLARSLYYTRLVLRRYENEHKAAKGKDRRKRTSS